MPDTEMDIIKKGEALLLKKQAEIERLERLLDHVWNVARDNQLPHQDRTQNIMTLIREKPTT